MDKDRIRVLKSDIRTPALHPSIAVPSEGRNLDVAITELGPAAYFGRKSSGDTDTFPTTGRHD